MRDCGTLRSVTTDHNPTSPPARTRTGLIVGIAVGAVLLIAGTVAVTLIATQQDAEPAAQQQTTAAAAATSAAPTPTYCPHGRLATGDCVGGTEAPPSAAPTSNQPPLTEAATCRQIVPLLSTVADAATALGKGDRPDVGQLQSVERQLRQVRDRAPEDMRNDLDAVILGATTMQIGNLDGTSLKESAISLLQRCRKYAA